MELNPEQKQAIAARKGSWCCMAAPGSGKTRVTVERFLNLVMESEPLDSILCLTFTREAAKEMAKRAGLGDDQRTFRTFHSFCLEFIIKEAQHLPFKLLHAPPEAGQQRKLLGTLCRQHRGIKFKDLINYISTQKRAGISPDKAIETCLGYQGLQYAQAYGSYEKQCRAQGWLDFDSIIVETANLLERNPEVRARWQKKWIQVDEAQDTDPTQWKIVKLLSEEHKNVFIVGDEEQLLYSWRGAVADGLSKSAELFPDIQFIYLFRNYRSTPQIVQFCKDNAPKQSELITRMRSENPPGPTPKFRGFGSDGSEAENVISHVLAPADTAILARTNRQLARFENVLIERGIKYNLLGKSGFWSQPEIRNTLAFVQASIYPTDAAISTVIKSPYQLTRFLKKHDLEAALKLGKKTEDTSYITLLNDAAFVGQFEGYQQETIRRVVHELSRLRNLTRNRTASDTMQIVLDSVEAIPYYESEEESDGDNDAVDNLNSLYQIASRFERPQDFLEYSRKAIAASRASKKGDRLSLSTIHQAKGKEWHTVFVVGVSEGVLPHKKSTNPAEERRIFFVACSRAAKELNISFVGDPSPYIKSYCPAEPVEETTAPAPPGYLGQPTLFEHRSL